MPGPESSTAEAPPPVTSGAAASAPPQPGHRRLLTWRNAAVGGVGAFALLGLAAVAFLVMRATGVGPAGTLVAKGLIEESEPVLLADFQSPSGA